MPFDTHPFSSPRCLCSGTAAFSILFVPRSRQTPADMEKPGLCGPRGKHRTGWKRLKVKRFVFLNVPHRSAFVKRRGRIDGKKLLWYCVENVVCPKRTKTAPFQKTNPLQTPAHRPYAGRRNPGFRYKPRTQATRGRRNPGFRNKPRTQAVRRAATKALGTKCALHLPSQAKKQNFPTQGRKTKYHQYNIYHYIQIA